MTANGISAAPPDDNPFRRASAAPGATTALMLLLFINMFNYIDRQVLAALEPEIEKTLFPAGGNPVVFGMAMPVEFWMGLLSTAFMVAFMLTAPLFGVLADRISRWKLMGFGVAVWSLASGASGLAAGFVAMLATRAVVGVGEAAYGPAAPAVLSDMYPVERRGRILSYFYVAIPVGSALGYVLGAVMGGLTHDWRWAFFVVVPPGLLLALLCLFMREPPRGAADSPHAHSAAWSDYLTILKTPSFLLCTLGYTATTFAVGGIAYWVPRYVSINRSEGSLFTVNMVFGGITVVAGLLSTLAGGWAGDALRKRFPGSYFLVSGAGMVLAFPLFLAVLITPFPWAYGLIFLTVFCLFFNTGPVNAIIANVTNPAVRASAFALVILIIHLFGDAFSPPAIGYVAGWARNTAAAAPRASWWTDFLGSHGGMDFSFCVVSLAIGLAAVLWFWGARYLEARHRPGADARGRARRLMVENALIAFAFLLSLTAARAADEPFRIQTVDAVPPKELAEPIRKLLAGRCVQLFAGDDKPLVEVWFRKEAPGDAVEVQIQNGLTYREIPETTLLGALRVVGDFSDYRRQKIAAGVYTLRLAFQPPTDDHQGTAPYTEFLLASPAAEDTKPDAMEHKALEKLSIKTTGKHPAVFLLFPGKNTTDEPKLVDKDDCRVLMVKQDVRVGEIKAVMGVGLTLIGASPKAVEKP